MARCYAYEVTTNSTRDTFGMFAFVIGYVAFLPQAYKIWKYSTTIDLSVPAFFFYLLSLLCYMLSAAAADKPLMIDYIEIACVAYIIVATMQHNGHVHARYKPPELMVSDAKYGSSPAFALVAAAPPTLVYV